MDKSEQSNVATSGSCDAVRFATAWSTNADPASAGAEAVKLATEGLGCPAKGVVFHTYYRQAGFVPADQTEVSPDSDAEKTAAKAVAATAGEVPSIGCRARALVDCGTLMENHVAVLAVGGERVSCAATATAILDDLGVTGTKIGQGLKDVDDLKVVIALAEIRLGFEAKAGVNVEDFIRGVTENVSSSATLLGGMSMCSPGNPTGQEVPDAQFCNGEPMTGYVVALGIGGPITVLSNHTDEFSASAETTLVTKARDKWVISLDGEPAADVYRRLRGMRPDETFTSEWQHPLGVVVAPEKVCVRIIMDWIDKNGRDRQGDPTTLPPGALRCVRPIAEGTTLRVLRGGDDAGAIIDSATQGAAEMMQEAQDSGAAPLLALLSTCCARGMRLRMFGKGGEDEVLGGILPVTQRKFPVFGFYAWGELGPIKGEYQGLRHQYQEHTFVGVLLCAPQHEDAG